MDPTELILQKKPITKTQSWLIGAVQSELNDINGSNMTVNGRYSETTAAAVVTFEKTYGLAINGNLNVQTFDQLQSIYGNSHYETNEHYDYSYHLNTVIPKNYKYYIEETSNSHVSNVPGDVNNNGIPDQYEFGSISGSQGMGNQVFKGESWLALAEGNIPYIYSTKDPNHNP